MEEGREVAAVLGASLDEKIEERLRETAAASPPERRVRVALEAVIELAEEDPVGAQEAVRALRADPSRLARIEAELSLAPRQAVLALGAAIQLASSELTRSEPDLRVRMPELLCWLEGDW